MPEALARRLAELESASTAELRARWERAHKHPAPKRASRDLLLRALAYHIQERAEGGLSKAAPSHLTYGTVATLNGLSTLLRPRKSY